MSGCSNCVNSALCVWIGFNHQTEIGGKRFQMTKPDNLRYKPAPFWVRIVKLLADAA